tara:strand:+ start:38117 stop:39379 length:1263 start_codon:yes stop_codon:yes gene_type:complete
MEIILGSFLSFIHLGLILISFLFFYRYPSKKIKLSLSLIFLIAFTLYSIPVEFSKIIYNDPWTTFDHYFISLNILAILGFILGNFSVKNKIQYHNFNVSTGNSNIIILFSLFIFFIFLDRQLYYLDYNLLNIFKAYLIESDKFENEKSTLDVILLSITSATALFYYIIIRKFNNKKLFVIYLFPIILIAFFLLVRGGRNPFIIFTLPLIVSEFINRKISVKYIFIGILILFPLTHFIAVVRGYGFEKILEYSTFNANYNPVDSEFGAPYRVLKIYFEGVINYPLQFGKTYFFDPIINLMPREIFPSRPLTIATRFSIDYFMNSKEMFGLGFSPILEVILNFTFLGILPFFCIVRYLLIRLDNMTLDTKFKYFGYLLLFPIIINFQRIDFAVCVKLYLIELIWILGLIYLSRFKIKIKPIR